MVVVEVIDSNRVVKRVTANEELFNTALKLARENENDLLTLFIFRTIRALLTPTGVGQNATVTFNDTGGTSRTVNIKGSLSYVSGFFYNTVSCDNKFWISYGSDPTPPTRDDYKLKNKLGEGIASMTYDESSLTLTLTAGWTFSSSITIYEVGLEWEGCVSGSGGCGRFLSDRTVFPGGISVGAGQTLSIAYKFVVP